MDRGIKVDIDMQNVNQALKADLIGELKGILKREHLSDAYKQATIRYTVKEVMELNESLNLPKESGLKEEWIIIL